jgi:hypothetical protein
VIIVHVPTRCSVCYGVTSVSLPCRYGITEYEHDHSPRKELLTAKNDRHLRPEGILPNLKLSGAHTDPYTVTIKIIKETATSAGSPDVFAQNDAAAPTRRTRNIGNSCFIYLTLRKHSRERSSPDFRNKIR